MSSYDEAVRIIRDILSKEKSQAGVSRTLLAHLMDLMETAGFRIIEQAAAFSDIDHTNLVGLKGPGGPGGLLLCSSLTTSPPVDHWRWTETEEDPFNPTLRDGFLFAQHATCGRVDWVCKLLAATRISHSELKRPLAIACLTGLHARISGAMHLLDSGICRPQWALVSEPTNLEIVTAHRGYVVLKLTLKSTQGTSQPKNGGRVFRITSNGSSTHSSTPTLGRNAVELAFHTLDRLKQTGPRFSTHRITSTQRMNCVPARCSFYIHTEDETWIPSGPYLTVESLNTSIDLGSPIDELISIWSQLRPLIHGLFRWSSPQSTEEFMPPTPIYSTLGAESEESGELNLWMDYRPLPGHRTEHVLRDLEALIRRSNDGRASGHVEIMRNLLPMDGNDNNALVEAMRMSLSEVGVPPVTTSYSGYTESWIMDAAQINTVAFGPGAAAGVRFRANEYVHAIHLHKAIECYYRTIKRLCC